MKGLFIPGITAKMFKDASLESVEELMAEEKVYDIDYQEPCQDAISRKEVLDGVDRYIYKSQSTGTQDDFYSFAELVVKQLPSVTPQPKTGHWIDVMVGDMPAQACDQCNTFYPLAYTGGGHKYCPICGAEMESEE